MTLCPEDHAKSWKKCRQSTAQIWHIFVWLPPHYVVLQRLDKIKYALGGGLNKQTRIKLLPARGTSDKSGSTCTPYLLTSSQIAHLKFKYCIMLYGKQNYENKINVEVETVKIPLSK